MNTLYITRSGRLMLNENNEPSDAFISRCAVSDIQLLSNDTDVVYEYINGDKRETKHLEGKAGDIVVTFYEKDFPNRVIIVNSKEWKENLDTYEVLEQKRKEEWAAKQAESCCAECDMCGKPSC